MSSDIAHDQPFFGFICTKCNYRCNRRNDLQKHFETQKHARMARRGLVMEQPRVVPVSKANSSSIHECICGKTYRHLSSLCKHRRKCDYFHSHMGLMSSKSTTEPEPTSETNEEVVLEENKETEASETADTEETAETAETEETAETAETEETEETEETAETKETEETKETAETAETAETEETAETAETEETAETAETEEMAETVVTEETAETADTEETVETVETVEENETIILKSDANAVLIALLNEQSKRNDELKDMIERQGKQLEIVAAKVDTPTVTNVTTINNTNKFNLNFFLNSECKDAMNVTDFVETINVTPADLDHLAEVGYVEGVARIMIDGLRKLHVSQRPIHCTDVKRESFYIKDNDVWEKDTSHGDKMHEVVKQVADRNVIAIPDWQKENPLHTDYSTDAHEQYLRIVNVAFGGANADDNENFRNKIIRKAAPELAPPKKTLQIKI